MQDQFVKNNSVPASTMSPAQQPSCLERLPPEVFLEIARHVADLDVRLILASRFILDNAATLTMRTARVGIHDQP